MKRPTVSISLALVLVSFWALVCVLPQVFAPLEFFANYPPLLSLGESSDGGTTHWLGTNHLGQDIYAYFIWAGRQTLLVLGIILLITYVFLGCVIAPIAVGAVYGNTLVRGICGLGVYICRAIPVVVLYVLLIGVLPATYGVGFAIVVGSAAGLFNLVSDYRDGGFDVFRGPNSVRVLGKLLWSDFLEKSRLALVLLLTFEFLGLWFKSGLGYNISESKSLIFSHPQFVLPYVLGIVSMLLAIGLPAVTARKAVGSMLSNEDRSIAIIQGAEADTD